MALATLPFTTLSDGSDAHLYLLSNAHGMTVGLTDVGASVFSVRVPDREGNLLDVALGHAGPRGYERADSLMGTTVGRVANRTAGARFELDGRTYLLAANEHANNNHSGPDLWSTRIWEVSDTSDHAVTFRLLSPAGDQGFPGEAKALVTYRLTDDDRLIVLHQAKLATRTPMNLTNHTYWNLDGHASGNVLGHTLAVDATRYLPTDAENIPTGERRSVEGTPFDLREGQRLGNCLDSLPMGYDHCFCLRGTDDGPVAHAARLEGERSGIVLDVLTDAPGLQVYMAGWLNIPHAKDGARYEQFGGVALEAQHWPDSIHHPTWPSVVYGPERPFSQTTTFAFSMA